MHRLVNRICLWSCLLAGTAPLLSACTSDGHFALLGYSTAPNYDCNIRTIYVPIFQNISFRRGIEFDLTKEVIAQIHWKTPFKVVSCRENADTELLGKIVNRNKALINVNQLGEIREGQVGLIVELVWRDLRPGHTGEFLSGPRLPEDPSLPPGPTDIPPALPVLIAGTATFIPEVGGSVTSAEHEIVQRLAVQIISMMEKGW